MEIALYLKTSVSLLDLDLHHSKSIEVEVEEKRQTQCVCVQISFFQDPVVVIILPRDKHHGKYQQATIGQD